jgi:hypothetical protein
MNFMELIEGGGLLAVSIILMVFAVTRSRSTSESWPKGILSTNALVLLIIATGFFGIAVFIDSFIA